MKIGSVKFFKRLIVSVFMLIVLFLVVSVAFLMVLYNKEKSRADELQAVNQILINDFVTVLASPEEYLEKVQKAAEENQEKTEQTMPSFPYQSLYPALYAQAPNKQESTPNMCYLTFDDGPSSITSQILDILQKEDVKATFFVTGKASELNPEILKRIVEEGHTIGVHTFSHKYEEIYLSVEAFLDDFNKMYTKIEEITGVAPQIFRFPGGSINSYNSKTYMAIIAEMTRRGFVFYDWNAAASDAVKGGLSKQQVLENVLSSASGYERVIVLLHDRMENATTVSALPDIIQRLRDRGFNFAALTNEVEPVYYYYPE